MVKTKINHPPNHNFYGWYKPFPNGWTISVLTTLISIQLNPPYSDCFTASPMRCFMRLWILWLIAPPGHCPSLPQRREWTELHQRYKKSKRSENSEGLIRVNVANLHLFPQTTQQLVGGLNILNVWIGCSPAKYRKFNLASQKHHERNCLEVGAPRLQTVVHQLGSFVPSTDGQSI